MAPSGEAFHADAEESTPLVRVGQAAPEAEERVVRTPVEDYEERFRRLILVPPKPFPWWRRLPFLGPDPNSIPVGQPLDEEQLEMLRKASEPGYFTRLALARNLGLHCLHYYNAAHPDNEYELAPGKVTRKVHLDNGACWTHGNFVARRKRSGCFSFLPAPRTPFFFETVYRNGSRGVVTCTPLDEPFTEAYSILGFPLWWSKRRSGKLDTICKTCSRRFYLPHPGIRKISLCGHSNARKVCEMCYQRSIVLHPKDFQFGCPDPRHPN